MLTKTNKFGGEENEAAREETAVRATSGESKSVQVESSDKGSKLRDRVNLKTWRAQQSLKRQASTGFEIETARPRQAERLHVAVRWSEAPEVVCAQARIAR